MRTVLAKRVGDVSQAENMARTINNSWKPLEQYMDTPGVRQLIAARAAGPLLADAPWDEWLRRMEPITAPLQTQISRAVANGAVADASFEVVDAISQKYAAEQAGKLIKAISDTQRTVVREVLTGAMSGNDTVDTAARKIKQSVGLHPQWARAVERQRERVYLNAVKEGATERAAQLRADKVAERYRQKLLRARALNIARTEIQTASNIGLYASWEQAVGQGFAAPDSRKEWAPGPRACPLCAPIAGEVVQWDQPFSNGVLMPPAHPGCRCTGNLLPPVYANESLNPRAIDWLAEGAKGQMAGIAGGPAAEAAQAAAMAARQAALAALVVPTAVAPVAAPLATAQHMDENWDWPEAIREVSRNKGLGGGEDEYLAAIYTKQGFHALPQKVSQAQFDAAVANGDRTVYRGIDLGSRKDTEKAMDGFINGDHHYAGKGVYGNGSYFAVETDTAMKYAKGVPEQMLTAAIDKRMRVIELDDAVALSEKMNKPYDADLQAWYTNTNRTEEMGKELLAQGYGPSEANNIITARIMEAQQMSVKTSDPGVVAAIHGYDAIRVPDPYGKGDYYVVLNRGILKVVEND